MPASAVVGRRDAEVPPVPQAPGARGDALREGIYAAIPIAATLLVFLPVTQAYFLGDDFVHLIDLVNRGLPDVLWRPFMGHLYAIPMLLYWALWRLAGMHAAAFYSAVLLVHLAAVALFFVVARALTGAPRLASVAATLWGTWPYHAGTLGWFCVHGHLLAGAALLLALRGLARATRDRRPVGTRAAAGWGLLLLAASTCFGTALGVAVVFPIAAWICAGSLLGHRTLAVMLTGAAAVVALYVAVHWYYPVSFGPRPGPALAAAVGAPARVVANLSSLTGFGLSRLIVHFWRWAPEREAAGRPALLNGAAALLIGIAAALAAPGRRRWLAGSLVLTVAAYAAVAVGRAGVQQQISVPPAMLGAMLRYHYLPSIPLALCLTLAVATLAAPLRLRPAVRDALAAAALVLLLVAYWRSDWRIDLHPQTRTGAAAVLDEAVAAAAAGPPGTTVYIRDRRFNPGNIWDPGYTSAGVFTLFNDRDEVDGRVIRYLPDPHWSPKAPPPGSRLARLLAPPP